MKKIKSAGTITTFLGDEDSLEGEIRFSGAIRLDGRVKGKIISEAGTLIVGDNAVIEGDVSVGTAIVTGCVTGVIKARERVEIYPPARIVGDVFAPVMSIEAGVEYNGSCNMTPRMIAKRSEADFSTESLEMVGIIEAEEGSKNL